MATEGGEGGSWGGGRRGRGKRGCKEGGSQRDREGGREGERGKGKEVEEGGNDIMKKIDSVVEYLFEDNFISLVLHPKV